MAKSANIKAANEKKRKLSSLQKQQKQKANKKRKIDQKRQNIENNNSHVNNTEDDYLITEEDEQFVSQNLGSLGFLQSIDEDELTISREAKNRTTKPKKKKVKGEDENKEEEYERVTRTSESWDKTTVIDKLPTKDVSSGKLVTFAPTPSIQLIQTKERLKEKEIRKEFEEKAEKDKLEKEKKTAPSKQALTAMSSIKKDIDDVGGKLPQFLYETMRKRDITAIELMVYMKQQKEYIATIAGQIIQDPESNYKKLHDLHILCEFNPSTYHLKTPKKKKNKEKYRKSKKFAHKKKGDHTTNDGDNDNNDDDENDVNEENDQTQHVEEDEDDKVNSNFIKTHSKARQLAVLSLAALYSDILPGYRIRQDSEDLSNTRQQLKKDVLKLRQYEVSLLAAYQRYLMLLERFIQEATPSLYLPSIKSYAQIIIAKPHFNFRTSILKVLIPLMAAHDDRVAKICCTTFESLFENDDSGDVSLESTKMISQFLKKRSYNVRSEVLQTFLKLRFTEDLSDHLKGGLSGNHLTKKQKKKMTKSQLKAKKEKDELDKELREAEAQESKENIRYNQSEILKTIFLVYFRIIKKVQNSPLVPSVLSGLAQFAHLINLDFQADLMKSIKELMNHPDTSLDIIARCTNTVFTNIKLHGGSTLDIDLKDFYEYLYQRLFDLPHNHSSLLLVLNCIKLMITENRDVLLSRAAAFVKRLATVSLQLPPYCILAVLTCFQRIFHFHPRMNRIIESNDDKAGTDVYLPLANNPDHANGLSSTLWELSLLEQHYHATVSERSVAVSEGKATRLQPDEIFHQFDSRSGGFNPPITKPSLHPHHKQLQKHPNHKIYIKAPYSSEFYQDLVDSLDSSPSSSEISFLNNNTHFSNQFE